jgi:peptidylprolyl isomerase
VTDTLPTSTSSEVIGSITLKLFDHLAPVTTQRFRELASGIHGYGYTGTSFHRIIPECVIQGGIVTLTDDNGDHLLYEELFAGKI